jgi:hypothetical protein
MTDKVLIDVGGLFMDLYMLQIPPVPGATPGALLLVSLLLLGPTKEIGRSSQKKSGCLRKSRNVT